MSPSTTKWANKIIAEGEALIPRFAKQFNASLDAYKVRYLAAQQAERDGASAADKAVVNKLIDKMYAATCVMHDLCSALRDQKIKELTVLMKQYRTLITSRLTATVSTCDVPCVLQGRIYIGAGQ